MLTVFLLLVLIRVLVSLLISSNIHISELQTWIINLLLIFITVLNYTYNTRGCTNTTVKRQKSTSINYKQFKLLRKLQLHNVCALIRYKQAGSRADYQLVGQATFFNHQQIEEYAPVAESCRRKCGLRELIIYVCNIHREHLISWNVLNLHEYPQTYQKHKN